MMNHVFKEYTEKLNNIHSNYEAIILKDKEVIKMNRVKKKILNIAATFVMVILVGALSTQIYAKIQWDIKFKEYQNREYEVGSGTIKEAVEAGYSEPIEMDYIVQDGISVKVDSLIMTDDHFNATMNFKFADNIELDSEHFSFGYAVYDEEKNVYGVCTRMHIGSKERFDTYTRLIYEEIGVNYKKNDIYAIQLNDTAGSGNVSAKDRNIISDIHMSSTKGFPKSKKIYIRVFDLGYSMVQLEEDNSQRKVGDAEDFSLSKAEWIFELNVPEKFYERQTTELKLKDKIPGLEVQKITVTELGLIVKAKIDGFSEITHLGKDMPVTEWQKLRNETVNITDEEGNIYYETTMGTVQRKDWFKMEYPINKNMLNKKWFLNVRVDGEKYRSELVQK